MEIKVTDLTVNDLVWQSDRQITFSKPFDHLLMLGYLVSFSDKRQTWHDYKAKTLMVRNNIFPGLYALPRISTRWLFELPGFGLSQNAGVSQPGYLCILCYYRSNEKHFAVRIAADHLLRRVRRDEGNSTCAQRYPSR